MRISLFTPEGTIFSGKATLVTLPGADGEFGVMEGHMPLTSLLRKGIVSVDERRFECDGGWARIMTFNGQETLVECGI